MQCTVYVSSRECTARVENLCSGHHFDPAVCQRCASDLAVVLLYAGGGRGGGGVIRTVTVSHSAELFMLLMLYLYTVQFPPLCRPV